MKFKEYLENRLAVIRDFHNLNISGLFNTFVYLCEWKYTLITGKRFSKSNIFIINNRLEINFINTELDSIMILSISFLLEKFCRDQQIKYKSPILGKESFSPRGYTGITHLCYCTYPFVTDQNGKLDLIKLVKNYKEDCK